MTVDMNSRLRGWCGVMDPINESPDEEEQRVTYSIDKVRETARKLASERRPHVPDKEALERQRWETYRRTREAQGIHFLESSEEEAALRRAAKKNAAHTTVYFSPDPPGWGS